MAKTKKTVEPSTPSTPSVEANGEMSRFTYYMPLALAEQLRDIAWWDRQSVNSVAVEAFKDLIAKREKKRGGPYPKRESPLP